MLVNLKTTEQLGFTFADRPFRRGNRVGPPRFHTLTFVAIIYKRAYLILR
jgi:hypothetical protein